MLRELRRDPLRGWLGAARIVDGASLPTALLPPAAGRVLRLVADSGAVFHARPETGGGWRLSCAGGSRFLPRSPDAPVVLAAHADGVAMGDMLLDPGLPAATDSPSLWRPADPVAAEPDLLVPLSGRGQTRASRVWVLAGADDRPQADDGLCVGPGEAGPEGVLWPVTGRGRIAIGGHRFSIATGADADAALPRLVMLGNVLSGLTGPGGNVVFRGEPQILGAEGDGPLRTLGSGLRLHPQTRVLGGSIAAWTENGTDIARARLFSLPAQTHIAMAETGPGQLRVTAAGLRPGWHLAVLAAGGEARAAVGPDGSAVLTLVCPGQAGILRLHLSDPASGAGLDLDGLWPTRQPVLITPDGLRLAHERSLSVARLGGWRGVAPGRNGALLLRLSALGAQVGFPAAGELRIAAMAPVIGQALALAGADGQVNLRLVDGVETPRLSIRRYDWESSGQGHLRQFPDGAMRLQAVDLEDPTRSAEIRAEGRVDLSAWLGEGPGLWFVQGWNEKCGVMRPIAWSFAPSSHSPREERLRHYAHEWLGLLDAPSDPRWDRAWTLIAAVRAAGDASALDQVQALERVPAAAVALLLLAPREGGNGRASALDIEGEAPIWWPLIPLPAWAEGVRVARRRLVERLAAARLTDAGTLANTEMARVVGEVVLLRPELAAHLGHALSVAGLRPEGTDMQGGKIALLPPAAVAQAVLDGAAQEAARSFDRLPQGVGRILARRLRIPAAANNANAPLLHAPLVAAEAAAGLRASLAADEILCLIALRAANSAWFDTALPAAVTLALSLPEPRR